MNLRLLIGLSLVSLVVSQCRPNYAIQDLASGSLQFSTKQGSANSTQKYQYIFTAPFPSTPSVALALQDFSLSSFGPNAFYVVPTQLTTSSIVFSFAYTLPIWSVIRFNFWASANSQIQLGYFSNPQLSVISNSAIATTNIQQAFGASDNPVVRVFLNGYQVQSSVVQIAVSPFNLQKTTLSVKIMLGPTTQIKGIWLSWIAFSPVTASFSAYGGSVGRSSFVGSFNSDVSSNLYQNSYLLYGLTQVSINGQDPLAYSCQISDDFQLSLSASRNFDSLGLVYIAAGNAPAKLCAACGANNVVYGNSCLSSCPLGTTPNTFKDGGVACLGTAVSASASATSSASASSSASSSSSSASSLASSSASSSSALSQASASSLASSASSSSALSQASFSTSSSSANVSCPKNAFFNGNECVCEVGYGYINGQCTALSVASAIPVTINPSASSSASTSASSSSALSSSSNVSAASSPSSASSSAASNTPITLTVVQPKPLGAVNCPSNSYDNGLGTCVCNSGYFFSAQGCVQGSPCPANSTRQANGSCKCDAGLTSYNGFCSKCPSGALWSSQSSSCIFVCGQNSIYNSSVNSCVCNLAYGLINGQCQTCPNNYFISNGYCVTCPVNSALNPNTNNCDCLTGYYTNQFGICTQKCGTNEIYDSVSQQCACLSGLGRVNGICTVCPAGSRASSDGSSCSICGENEQLVGGICVCKAGYALNSAKVCTICSNLPNGFIINGICSVCPSSLIFNGNQGCSCPGGKILQGTTCISQCKSDELLDSQGNCYTCGNNQVISNSKCVCTNGYILSSCGICTLSCSSNQFVFRGGCATCPLNTVYNSQIATCSCPNGYYKDTYGVCQQLVLKPITCNAGQYFDSTQGCLTCPGSCKTCSSATQCLTCSTNGFSANSQGVCQPTCGDGLILGRQTCDTGLSYSAGCINCQVQGNWNCSGQPSVCASNTPTPAPAPTPTPTPAPAPTPTPSNNGSSGVSNLAPLYQSGNATINSNNVFVTLKTNPTFSFANPTEMQSFIKADFPRGAKPTVYCSQRQSPNLDTFDCLLIYPSGVPNQAFNINFSYNFQSKSGSATVRVDPFAATNNRRGRQ